MIEINDADELARWLETDPPAHEQVAVLEDMIGVFGDTATTLMWNRAILSLPAGADQ